MTDSAGRVYVVIGHNDLDCLDAIKERILSREGIVSAEVGRLPAVYGFARQRGTMFSVRPPSLTPLCDHAVVILCENAVTVIGDILDTASDLLGHGSDRGVVFAVGEEVLDLLKEKQRCNKPSDHVFPEELILDSSCVTLDFQGGTKEEVLNSLCLKAEKLGFLHDVGEFWSAILKREEIQSTGAGEGLAFPHAHCESVKKPFLLAMRSDRPIEFGSVDGMPVSLVLMLGYPEEKQTHLAALAWLGRRLLNKSAREGLLAAKTPERIVELLKGN